MADIRDKLTAKPIQAVIEPDCTFIMQRAGGIKTPDPTRQGVVVGAIAAFIAQRPQDNTGVIFVTLDHAYAALDKSVRPHRIVG